MNFKTFLNSPKQIVEIAQHARKELNITKAHFGDCNEVCNLVVKLLNKSGIKSKKQGSYFNTGEVDFEHSWVVVNGNILDPTLDQFFSELDEDMDTLTPGIYYSHPDWDGNKYTNRYK